MSKTMSMATAIKNNEIVTKAMQSVVDDPVFQEILCEVLRLHREDNLIEQEVVTATAPLPNTAPTHKTVMATTPTRIPPTTPRLTKKTKIDHENLIPFDRDAFLYQFDGITHVWR